jgi:hypothetical protein
MGAIEEYRARRAKRLAEKAGARLDEKDKVAEYKKRRAARLKARGYRADAPYQEPTNEEVAQLQGSRGGGGGHGNTRLPFGLCKRFGIDIDPNWQPKDAWDALAGKGITPNSAFEALKKGEDPAKPKVFKIGGKEYSKIAMKVRGKLVDLYGTDSNGEQYKITSRGWGEGTNEFMARIAKDYGLPEEQISISKKDREGLEKLRKSDEIWAERKRKKAERIAEFEAKAERFGSEKFIDISVVVQDNGRVYFRGKNDYGRDVRASGTDDMTWEEAIKAARERGGHDIEYYLKDEKAKKEYEKYRGKSEPKVYKVGAFQYSNLLGKQESNTKEYTVYYDDKDGRRSQLSFSAKADAMRWLKKRGIDEFEDADAGGKVNPMEMDLPKPIFETGNTGYTAVKVHLRGGKYEMVGTNFNGEQKKLVTADSLDKMRTMYERQGGNWDDVTLVKKKVPSWMKSDKKEYVERKGEKYGNLSVEQKKLYGGTLIQWIISGADEDGKKAEVIFGTKAEALNYLKKEGVQKIKLEGKEYDPQQFDETKLDGKKAENIESCLKTYRRQEKLSELSCVDDYKRRRAARLKARGYRADAPYQEPTSEEVAQLQGSRGGGGGHGNTRLPFGLCKRFGIDIDPSWTPKDAWAALAGKGITPEKAFEALKKGEDPGKVGTEGETAVKAEPVKKIVSKDYGDAEYGELEGKERTWGKPTEKWELRGKKIDGTGSGGFAPAYMSISFRTKTDMMAYLKDKGVEEFADPETGEVVNPKEMDIPEPALKIKTYRGTTGYTALTLGLRGGRYVLTGTDYDGGKVKLGDWSTIDKAKDYVQRFGGKVEDMKMSPALKKREAERVAWLKSDKKEYFEKDGVKYGDVEISYGGYYGWTISGESEDGQKVSVRANTKAEAMQYLKEQGVQKVRINKDTFNPQEYEIPKTVAEVDGHKYQKLEIGFVSGYYGSRAVLIGTDLDGKQSYVLNQLTSGSTYADFEKTIKKYGISEDQIEISDENKAKIEQIKKEEIEKERRKAEFEAKAEWFRGSRYSDVEISSGLFGPELYGYTESGDKRRIATSDGWSELKQYLAGCRKGDADIERYIKDDSVRKSYEEYKKGIKEFEAKAKEFGGRKYANVKISRAGDNFVVHGVDESGRKAVISYEDSYADLEKMFDAEGYTVDMFDVDENAAKAIDTAKKAKEAIASGKYYSLGKTDRAYKDVRIEQDSDGWKIKGTGTDDKEHDVETVTSWNDAIKKLSKYGVSGYKVKDKSGAEMGMPSMGMHSVMLMKKPDGGFAVYADTPSDTHKVMHEAKTEQEARKWLRENNVPDGGVKTRGMNPNDSVVRSIVPKTLTKFDEHRMNAIEGSFVDEWSSDEKQEACDMLTEMFKQGKPRAFRSSNSMFGILTEGYKSQIEIGHGGAAAADDIQARKALSKKMYGHSGMGKTEYEKYGFLGSPNEAEDWNASTKSYGGGVPVLYTFKKDSLEDRMTYTYGDSLNSEQRLKAAGYGGSKPTIEGFTSAYSKDDLKRAFSMYKRYKDGQLSFNDFMRNALDRADNHYLELQYHGDVTAKDIESLGFYDKSGIDIAFKNLDNAQRKQILEVLKNNDISIYYRENGYNVDAREYLENKYGAGV